MIQTTGVNYEDLFRNLTESEWISVGIQFPSCRLFQVRRGLYRKDQLRKAFTYAQSMEDEGYTVSLGEFCGDYYVWVRPGGEKPYYPQTPEEQVFCEHGNHIWFGHECGECEN